MFAWQNRTYKIKQLHGYHQARTEGAMVHQWSVSVDDTVFVLEWNNQTLQAYVTGVEDAQDRNRMDV